MLLGREEDEDLNRRLTLLRQGTDPSLGSAIAKVSKWLSFAHASTTITGSGYSSVADVLGGNAATQSTDARRPAADTANGYPIATFSDDFLSLPLDASVNDNVKYGVAFWLKLANTTGSKVLTSIQTGTGASADKMLHFISGTAIQARAMNVDRRAQAGTLDTGWHFVYLGIDSALGSEDAQVLMGIDAALQLVSFSSDTAWPSTLGTPTGTMFLGANSTAPGSPLVGSVGTDIWFLQSQLTVAEQAALMALHPPLP